MTFDVYWSQSTPRHYDNGTRLQGVRFSHSHDCQPLPTSLARASAHTKPVPGDNQRAKADAPTAHHPHTSELAAAGVTTGRRAKAEGTVASISPKQKMSRHIPPTNIICVSDKEGNPSFSP